MSYQDIIDDAWGLSSKNQPGETATAHPELTGVIHRTLKAIYMIAASVNPPFFGAKSSVSPNNPGWTVPTEAELVFHIEDPSGAEVITVRYDERDTDTEKPAVYQLGRDVYPAGNANDPDDSGSGDDLTFFFAQGPGSAPTAASDSLPATWDDSHAELLVLQTGIYLARKDMGGRQGELQALRADRDKELLRFIRKLENYNANIVSRFSGRKLVNTESVVNHRELLTGAISGGGG